MLNTDKLVQFYEGENIANKTFGDDTYDGSIIRDTTTNKLYIVDDKETNELSPMDLEDKSLKQLILQEAKKVVNNTNFSGPLSVENGGTGKTSLTDVSLDSFKGPLSVEKGGTGVNSLSNLLRIFNTYFTFEIDNKQWKFLTDKNIYVYTYTSDFNLADYQLFVDINLAGAKESDYSTLLTDYQKIARVYPDSTSIIVVATSKPTNTLSLNVIGIRIS